MKETLNTIAIILTMVCCFIGFIIGVVYVVTVSDIKMREQELKHKELCINNGTGFYYDTANKIVCK